MERAGEFLGRVVRRLDRPDATLAWLVGAWPTIVGQALAAHTRPVQCREGRLEVAADASAWRAQLEPMTREFCARINRAWGGNLVREVRFVTAKPGPHGIPRELDNEHIPFVRRRKS